MGRDDSRRDDGRRDDGRRNDGTRNVDRREYSAERVPSTTGFKNDVNFIDSGSRRKRKDGETKRLRRIDYAVNAKMPTLEKCVKMEPSWQRSVVEATTNSRANNDNRRDDDTTKSRDAATRSRRIGYIGRYKDE